MSTESATPLSIEIGVSWWLGAYLTVIHSGAVLGIALTSLSIPIKGIVATIVLSSYWLYMRKHVVTTPRRINRVSRSGNGEWILYTPNAQSKTQELVSVFESGMILILRFKVANRLIPVLIARDAVDAADYRRLRAVLRDLAHTAAGAPY